ncbi:hypothetical protein IAD21_02974 [Abditibacteriota bacterium]|nr:hypothetical protein IAD21_02974 [Abditibacteriota bacterium]
MFSFLKPSRGWDEKRLLIFIALATLVVSVVWHIPQEIEYISARGGELLVALTLSLSMFYVLRPVVRMLERGFVKVPHARVYATIIAFLLFFGACYVFFLIGFKPVQHDIKDFWPHSPEDRAKLMAQWQAALKNALASYSGFIPADVIDDPSKYITGRLGPITQHVTTWLSHQTAHLGFVVELLLIPVLAFYFLSDGQALRREARLLFPVTWRARLSRMGHQFDHILDGYVRGQVWMCLIAWVLVTIALLILHVPHAFTLGLIAGLTRAIPVIGPLLGGIPLLVACLFYTQSVQTTGILLGAFTLMHFLESKVLLPKIVGHHVDLHPVTVIMALLIGMEFFGAMGVILAVPIAAMIKVLLSEYHNSQERKLVLAAQNGDATAQSDLRELVVAREDELSSAS